MLSPYAAHALGLPLPGRNISGRQRTTSMAPVAPLAYTALLLALAPSSRLLTGCLFGPKVTAPDELKVRSTVIMPHA